MIGQVGADESGNWMHCGISRKLLSGFIPVYVPFMVFGVSRFTISMGILLIVN